MTASDHLSIEQFGLKSPDPELNDFLRDKTEEGFYPSERRISLRNLRASQSKVNPELVEHYRQHPRTGGTSEEDKPFVIKYQGEHVVWDGHHRIAGAIARGQKRMRLDVQDEDYE